MPSATMTSAMLPEDWRPRTDRNRRRKTNRRNMPQV
jgi:hypothetical protein